MRIRFGISKIPSQWCLAYCDQMKYILKLWLKEHKCYGLYPNPKSTIAQHCWNLLLFNFCISREAAVSSLKTN